MPLPESLARFNRVVSNRVMRPLALIAPGFGVLHHRGRRTGKEYQTPLNVFQDGDRLIVALTYGEDVDWLKNARSSAQSHFILRGKRVKVGTPVDVPSSEGLATIPAPVTWMLKLLGVSKYVAFPIID